MRGVLVVFCLLLQALAQASDVAWFAVSEAPAVIAEGPLAGLGAHEIEVQILARALPQFGWRLAVVRPLRALHEIQHRDGGCSFGFARLPEREGTMLFNARPMVVPGYGVILREDRLPDFQRFLDGGGALDLARLRGAPLQGAYVAGRPHFGVVKEFIEAGLDRPHLIASADTAGLFRQLASGRIDFLFGLRDETNYFAESVVAGAHLVALRIAGTEQWGRSYLGCSTGPVGRRAMAVLDDWLADDRHWAEFIEPWKRWLSPEDYSAALKSQTNPVR